MFSIYDCETKQRVSDESYATAEEAGHDYYMNQGHTYVGVIPYAERAAVIGQVILQGDVLCNELQPSQSRDGSRTTRWLVVIADTPENDEHGAYKAGHVLTLTTGISDRDVVAA